MNSQTVPLLQLPLILLVAHLESATCRQVGGGTLNNHHNITHLLDSLLVGYNKHLRPDFGLRRLEVMTNILIRSMGPVSEENMMFSMDCYFRQMWKDDRLAFDPRDNITELRPSIKMLDEIWKPDTYFLNGQGSYLHTITYSNKLFRINTTGDTLYSQRLTIKSTCTMDLHKYPLDTQHCPLMFGSYGYAEDEVVYMWAGPTDPVKKYKDITMAQFDLTDIEHGRQRTGDNHGSRTVLYVSFRLEREIGYYLLQIYLPCYLIVIISWVSFWINREAAPARVTLGITTLLTTCTLALTGRAGIPKVAYSTALDVFLLMCFFFVFAAIVEYAGVNYFTKGAQNDFTVDSDTEEIEQSAGQTRYSSAPSESVRSTLASSQDINGQTKSSLMAISAAFRRRRNDAGSSTTVPAKSWRCSVCCGSVWSTLTNCVRGRRRYDGMRPLGVAKAGLMNSVSQIDTVSRFLFPFAFVSLNILYWAGFLYYF